MEIIALKVKNLIQTRNRVLVVLWPVTFLIDRQTVHCGRLISAKFVGKSHPLDGKKPFKLEHMRMFT